MFFGKHIRRLMSPFTALIWLALLVGFAGTAQADPPTDPAAPQAADHAQASDHAQAGGQTQASDQAQAAAATKPAPSPSADHGPGSGDLTSPQPISNADANTGGANGQCPGGPYCSTRDGSPSANGNGGGAAVGKPCAGCVGKADNKNPHGQMPNGSDANAGYECDTNHGIGRTNPAHTGCQPVPECVPSASNNFCGQPQPGCVPSASNNFCGQPQPGCVPSASNDFCGQPQPIVTPPSVSPPLVSPPSVSAPVTTVQPPVQAGAMPPSSTVPSSAGLPQTGAPSGLVGEAALAVLVLLAGAALVAIGRRPRLDS